MLLFFSDAVYAPPRTPPHTSSATHTGWCPALHIHPSEDAFPNVPKGGGYDIYGGGYDLYGGDFFFVFRDGNLLLVCCLRPGTSHAFSCLRNAHTKKKFSHPFAHENSF